MIGRYQVDVWYSLQVDADSDDDVTVQAIEQIRATVDQPASVDVVPVTPRDQVKS